MNAKHSRSEKMLSPAMLKHSLTRRTSLREKPRSNDNSQRITLTPATLDTDEHSLDVHCLPLVHPMERKSSGSQRGSMDQILGQPKVSDPSGFEVDLLFTSNNDIILLPHRDSSPNIVLSRGMDELQVSSSKNRRQSLGAGVFDISARGSNSSSDIRKRRRESNKETLMMRRDSGIQEFDARTSAPVYAIYPHQYTEDPTVAWEMLKTKRPVKNVRQMKLDAPIKSDHVRFVCVACTHGVALDPASLPPGDILIIAGDFTSCGLPKEVKSFNENMALMKHTFKIAISGNHECTFDDSFLKSAGKDIGEAKEVALKQALSAALSSAKVSNPRSLLTNVIYLQDSMVELFGIRIYGTPWQPRMDNWAFNLPRGQPLLNKWNQIPTGVDVLITHTPPLGHGDMLSMGSRAGCVELLNSVVKRIRPKYHVFGHVHEGYGCTSDGYTKFINCCLMNENLEMTNRAIIFDIPVDAEAKSQFLQSSKKLMKKLLKK